MCGGEWHLEVEEQAVVLGLFSNNHAESYGQHDQLGRALQSAEQGFGVAWSGAQCVCSRKRAFG